MIARTRPRRSRSLLLSGIDWRTYSRLLQAFEDHPGVRLIYDRGDLEIMSPSLQHEGDAQIIHDFVFVLAEELGLTLRHGGSATLRKRDLRRGIEGDKVFWLQSAPALVGVRKLNLTIHPPPDLAVEVEITRSAMAQLPIYAALRVPEVWRIEADRVSFYVLGEDGTHAAASRSRAFPILSPADLLSFLQQARAVGDQIHVARLFRAWVQAQPRGAV